MLRIEDVLFNPEDVQPLGSRKGVLNKPTKLTLDLNVLFIEPKNCNLVKYGLFDVYRQNGGKASEEKFNKLVSLLQQKFAKNKDLNNYVTAENQATGTNNYVEALRAINQAFSKEVYKYFRWNNYNPFHHNIEVGPSDNRKVKKSAEIQPEDHNTLDVWREQFTQVLNAHCRYNNKIPVWRTGIHTRHYDRSNEGLQYNNPDRASLETPIYAYDMAKVSDGIPPYKLEGWMGM